MDILKFLNQKMLLFGMIVTVGLIVLALPFSHWGLKTDDFGNLYHARVSSGAEFARFFYEGNMECVNHPSNIPKDSSSGFLSGLYRPMSFLYYWPQVKLFGSKSYGYFFVTTLFHVLNAGLLFLLLAQWLPVFVAALGGLYFCFHPSLWNWLGWVSAQTYFIELFVQLLIIFLLLRSLQKKAWGSYVLACFLFGLNLLLKEQSIVLPFLVILAAGLFARHEQHLSWWLAIKRGLSYSIGFLIIVAGYAALRLYSLPFNGRMTTLTCGHVGGVFGRLQERLFDFVSYASDSLGLSFLPNGHQFLKGMLIIGVTSLGLFLLLRSSNKMALVFLLVSALVFSWPALLMHYQPRYIYLALPFLVAFFASAGFALPATWKKSFGVLVLSLIAINAQRLHCWMGKREAVFYAVKDSFEDLLGSQLVGTDWQNRPLCFVGLPDHWFAMGTAQAIWFLAPDYSMSVYQVGPLLSMTEAPGYLTVPQTLKAQVTIQRYSKEFLLKTSNPGIVSFVGAEAACENRFFIEEDWMAKNPIIIFWDFEKGKFAIMPE